MGWESGCGFKVLRREGQENECRFRVWDLGHGWLLVAVRRNFDATCGMLLLAARSGRRCSSRELSNGSEVRSVSVCSLVLL